VQDSFGVNAYFVKAKLHPDASVLEEKHALTNLRGALQLLINRYG